MLIRLRYSRGLLLALLLWMGGARASALNVTIDYRWADDQDDRLAALTADLVRRQAAVVVTNSIGVRVAKMVTATTPLVFVAGSDPVRTGLVPSLNRPGGNVTGVSFVSGSWEPNGWRCCANSSPTPRPSRC